MLRVLLTTGYGLLGGLLAVMVITAVLFVVITVIALRPVKTDKTAETPSAQQLLAGREAELLSEYENKQDDKKAAEEIVAKLREVSAARKLLTELSGEGKKPSVFDDDDLTEEQAASLENENEKVAIENTFTPEEGSGLNKSFTAKLIQSSDELKVSYFEIKNCLLCYEKTKSRMHWNNEKFYIGKKNVATMTVRGKCLCLYLAMNAEDCGKSFRVKQTVSTTYSRTPCLYRVKGKNDVKNAKALIALLMADYGVMYVRTNHSIYALPYEDDDALAAKGLVKRKEL